MIDVAILDGKQQTELMEAVVSMFGAAAVARAISERCDQGESMLDTARMADVAAEVIERAADRVDRVLQTAIC